MRLSWLRHRPVVYQGEQFHADRCFWPCAVRARRGPENGCLPGCRDHAFLSTGSVARGRRTGCHGSDASRGAAASTATSTSAAGNGTGIARHGAGIAGDYRAPHHQEPGYHFTRAPGPCAGDARWQYDGRQYDGRQYGQGSREHFADPQGPRSGPNRRHDRPAGTGCRAGPLRRSFDGRGLGVARPVAGA